MGEAPDLGGENREAGFGHRPGPASSVMAHETTTPTETITREQAVLMLTQGMGGKIFGMSFHKRTADEVRDGTFRLSASMSKGKTGKGKSYKDTDKGLIGIYDTKKQGYRSVGIENIISIRTGGKEYVVEEKAELHVLVLNIRVDTEVIN